MCFEFRILGHGGREGGSLGALKMQMQKELGLRLGEERRVEGSKHGSRGFS